MPESGSCSLAFSSIPVCRVDVVCFVHNVQFLWGEEVAHLGYLEYRCPFALGKKEMTVREWKIKM